MSYGHIKHMRQISLMPILKDEHLYHCFLKRYCAYDLINVLMPWLSEGMQWYKDQVPQS